MATKNLNAKIDEAINNLLVHFKVTEDELKRFKKPKIMRTLDSSKYPDDSNRVPGYCFTENFFYFPIKDPGFSMNVFSEAIIHHEASHYIHNFINPEIAKVICERLATGKMPPGFHNLTELVAEYGNFILGYGKENGWRPLVFHEQMRVYEKCGKEFLPCLARMSLEEAINKDIVKRAD